MKKFIAFLLLPALAFCMAAQAYAQSAPFSFTAPVASPLTAPYPILYSIPIQNCDGATDLTAAINTANALGAANGELYFGGGTCLVNSSVIITRPIFVAPGATLKPASGATISVRAAVRSGAWKIIDFSAGGHVDMTAVPNSAFVEWWGAVGGSTDYNTPTANATANTAAWTEALTYMPGELRAQNCGYSVTGLVLDGIKKRTLVGCGKGVYTLIGSGIPFVYAGHLVVGDYCKSQNMVLQNGVSPNEFQQLINFGVTSNSTSVMAVAICSNDSTLGDPTLMWQISSIGGRFGGRVGASPGSSVGWYWSWANGSTMIDNTFNGRECAEKFYLPATPGVNIALQKVAHYGGDWAGTDTAVTTLICMANVGGVAITNLSWAGSPSFESANLVATMTGAAAAIVFDNPWMERITTIAPAVVEGVTSSSEWRQPRASFNIANGLLLGLNANSTATIGNAYYLGAAGLVTMLQGAGSPNGSVFAGRGSVYYRTDSSNIAETPCYQFNAAAANTGWVNGAAAAC